MRETSFCFHNLEWPAPQSVLCGPIIWLRGWVVGKPGCNCIDLRVRHEGATHLGVLGLPRTDLAQHFKSEKPWIPAEYIIGVPIQTDGPLSLTLEVMDAHGLWHDLETIELTISADGQPAPRVEGRLEASPHGTWTMRDAHHPFHGHLDQPGNTPQLDHGRAPIIGWLLDENASIKQVLATTDTLVFNHLEHSKTDDALAIKVPEHTGAKHARLKGFVDYPATLTEPASLRVYSESNDGTVTLCFAQRIATQPKSIAKQKQHPEYPPIEPRELAAYPSGRPRRALFLLRSLLPDDACLRALDLVRHLKASHEWAVRVVAMEDGPMRDSFLEIDAESLIVDPGAFFAAPDESTADIRLADLEKQIRWDHLDAVIIFDSLCGWALPIAKRRGIASLFDCGHAAPLEPDLTAIPHVQNIMRASWRSTEAVCFPAHSVANAQGTIFADTPATIIPHWHSPEIDASEALPESRVAMAPLRTVAWLRQHHPEVAARWQFCQGPATETSREILARLDEQFNAPALKPKADWDVRHLSLYLGPLFDRGPIRPILDALASNLPSVPACSPIIDEYLSDSRLPTVDESNPLALAHHLIAFDHDPAALRRETECTGAAIRESHAPARLLHQWVGFLSSVVASHG